MIGGTVVHVTYMRVWGEAESASHLLIFFTISGNLWSARSKARQSKAERHMAHDTDQLPRAMLSLWLLRMALSARLRCLVVVGLRVRCCC